MENILNKIIRDKYREIESLKKKYGQVRIEKKPDVPGKFRNNFTDTRLVKIISEIKPASPSEGEIIKPTKANIQNIAKIYSQYPIGAISVLTDSKYFNGNYENIALVKEVSDKPVLCKEFIIDKYQIDLAVHFGADAVLLIAEATSQEKIVDLYHYAVKCGLDVLFEFHHPENLQFLLDNNIEIIGINNRDLKTLKVDIQKCLSLRNSIPDESIIIAESGFNSAEEIRLLHDSRFNGVLIGTSLLKAQDPGKKLEELVNYNE